MTPAGSHDLAAARWRPKRTFGRRHWFCFLYPNDAARLSHERFRAGTAAYLEVLTNETNAFSYQLQLAQARGNELTSLVQLYQALGGGWQ